MTQVLKDDIALEKFIEDLVDARQDLWVEPQNREVFKRALMSQLKDEINVHFINLLTKKDQELLSGLLDRGVTSQELDVFFKDRVDNPVAHMAEVMQKFKEMVMLGSNK